MRSGNIMLTPCREIAMKRNAFGYRMTFLLVASVAASVVLQLPEIVHTHFMKRKFASVQAEGQKAVRDSHDTTEMVNWFSINGFTVSGPWRSPRDHEFRMQRVLGAGNLLWKPCTARVWINLDRTDEFKSDEWAFSMVDFTGSSSSWSGFVPRNVRLLLLATLILIAILVLRREIRRANNWCIECGYDL